MGALLTLIFILLLLHGAYKIITAPAPLTRAEMEQRKGNDGERKVLQALADLEITHILHDVYLKGNRNVNQIDIIARAGNSILVIEVKNWDCRLRCNKKGPWDVLDADGNVVEQRKNPLNQNYGHTQTVKEFLQANGHENVVDNVIGLTVSTGYGISFEGCKPDNFLTLGEAIPRITKIAQQGFTASSYDAWKTLKSKATDNKQSFEYEHNRITGGKTVGSYSYKNSPMSPSTNKGNQTASFLAVLAAFVKPVIFLFIILLLVEAHPIISFILPVIAGIANAFYIYNNPHSTKYQIKMNGKSGRWERHAGGCLTCGNINCTCGADSY